MAIQLAAVFSLFTVGVRLLAAALLAYKAFKVLLLALFMTVMPLMLKTVIYWFMESMIEAANANLSAEGLQGTVLNLTGLAGYLADLMQLPLCASVILSAVAYRATLGFLRIY